MNINAFAILKPDPLPCILQEPNTPGAFESDDSRVPSYMDENSGGWLTDSAVLLVEN